MECTKILLNNFFKEKPIEKWIKDMNNKALKKIATTNTSKKDVQLH